MRHHFTPHLDTSLIQSGCFLPSTALAIQPEELAGFEKEIYSKEKLITEEEEKEGLKRADETYYAKRVEASARFLCQDSEKELHLLYLSLCGRAHHASNDTSSPEQKAYFRATYLQHLNEMAFLIHRKKSASTRERIKILKDFLLQIFPEHEEWRLATYFESFDQHVICSGGMRNALEQRVSDLTAVILIPDAIARFRQEIVFDWTTKRLAASRDGSTDPDFSLFGQEKYKISIGNETHYHTTTRRFSQSQNWNLPIAAGIHQHHDMYETRLTETEEKSLIAYFYKEFSASAIVNHLYTHFYSELSKYKQKVETNLVLQNHVAFLCATLGIDDPIEIFDYSSSEPIVIEGKKVVSQLIQLKERFLQDDIWLHHLCFMLGDNVIKEDKMFTLIQQTFVKKKIMPLIDKLKSFFKPEHSFLHPLDEDAYSYFYAKNKELEDILAKSERETVQIDDEVMDIFSDLRDMPWFKEACQKKRLTGENLSVLLQLKMITSKKIKTTFNEIKEGYACHKRKNAFLKLKQDFSLWKDAFGLYPISSESVKSFNENLHVFSKKIQQVELSIDEIDRRKMDAIQSEWSSIQQALKTQIDLDFFDETARFKAMTFEFPDSMEKFLQKLISTHEASDSTKNKALYERYKNERAIWHAKKYRKEILKKIESLGNQSFEEGTQILKNIGFFYNTQQNFRNLLPPDGRLDEKSIEQHIDGTMRQWISGFLKKEIFLSTNEINEMHDFVSSCFQAGLVSEIDYTGYQKKQCDLKIIRLLRSEFNKNKSQHPVLKNMKEILLNLIADQKKYPDLQQEFLKRTAYSVYQVKELSVYQGKKILDQRVVELLEKTSFLKPEDKKYYENRQFIEANILPVLHEELNRLDERKDHTAVCRKKALEELIREITIQSRMPDNLNCISTTISWCLYRRHVLDPDYLWYEQLLRGLLNILSVLIVPAVIKYCVTGTPFYALKCSRTREVVESAQNELTKKLAIS